jgi:hypothetical protein
MEILNGGTLFDYLHSRRFVVSEKRASDLIH